MLKRGFHIIFALLLVFTTTTSIWGNLIADEDDPIEVKTEKESDTEESEKKKEKEQEDNDDDLFHTHFFESSSQRSYSGLILLRESEFPGQADKKLYILYQHLKLDC